MNLFIARFLCSIIPTKKWRHDFRKKYVVRGGKVIKKLEKIDVSDFNTLMTFCNEQNVDFANDFIFSFGGGLTDQFLFFSFALYFALNNNKHKIHFCINRGHPQQGGWKLGNFNIKKYVKFNEISISDEVEDLYNKYHINSNSDYYFAYKHLNDLDTFVPPFFFASRMFSFADELDLDKEYEQKLKESMELITPLNRNSKEKLKEILACENSVMLHIRRGDFIGLNREIVSIDYINRAITKMIALLKENITFFVFSQDMEWIKNGVNNSLFKDNNKIDYVEINSDLDSQFELELMRNCKHFICSVGGFSYLPVFLSKNENKIVIKPNKLNQNDWE